MMRAWPFMLAVAIAAVAIPVVAQEQAAPPSPDMASSGRTEPATAAQPARRGERFQFVRVGDNILRLDGDSGAVSLCNARGTDWACQALPEDRAALDRQIAQLSREIGELKSALAAQSVQSRREVESLRDELKAMRLAAAPPPPVPERGRIELRLPTAQDYERARAVVEDAWRRLVEGVAQVQSDAMRRL